jgi:hypothetical protein
MKNNYLGFTEGEITVYCGYNSRANVHCSLQQARAIAGSSRKGNILYVNTVYTTRKLLAAARQELGKTEGLRIPPVGERSHGIGQTEGIYFKHTVIGDLCKYLDEFREMIEADDIKYLIVNSWDFANRTYGFKEKALIGLMNIANELGVSVFVYSQASMRNAVVGEMHRGGLGKLAAVADDIIWCNQDEIMEQIVTEERKVRILSERKINELEYAHSGSGVSVGGELILPPEEVEMEEELMEV